MAASSFDHARVAFDFIERLDQLITVEQVVDETHRSLTQFGFEHLTFFSALPQLEQQFEHILLGKRLNSEWARVYAKEGIYSLRPFVSLFEALAATF